MMLPLDGRVKHCPNLDTNAWKDFTLINIYFFLKLIIFQIWVLY